VTIKPQNIRAGIRHFCNLII